MNGDPLTHILVHLEPVGAPERDNIYLRQKCTPPVALLLCQCVYTCTIPLSKRGENMKTTTIHSPLWNTGKYILLVHQPLLRCTKRQCW